MDKIEALAVINKLSLLENIFQRLYDFIKIGRFAQFRSGVKKK